MFKILGGKDMIFSFMKECILGFLTPHFLLFSPEKNNDTK